METWNDRMRAAIKDSPISASELARRIELSPASISDWTSGKTKNIEAEPLLKACRELKIRPEWILFAELPREDSPRRRVLLSNYDAADDRGKGTIERVAEQESNYVLEPESGSQKTAQKG